MVSQPAALPYDEGEAQRQFLEFFNEAYYRQVLELAQAYPDSRSLYVNFSDLSKFDYRLADALVERPDTYIKAAEAAARELKVPTVGESSFSPHVRIVGLAEAGVSPLTVQNLGAEHLNKLVSLEGVVTLITQIMPKLSTARWVCIHCTRSIDTLIGKTGIDKPTVCPGCGRGDGLFLSEQTSGFVNMQRSQVQDPVEKIRGNIPAPQVDLWLEDDLTNTISPGENLEVTGILRLRQNPQSKGKSPVYSKFFDVVSIQKQQREFEELTVTKEEEAEIVELSKDPLLFDKVVMSIAPSIYGYSEMKEAIALQLFGGTPFKVMPDGKKIRSDLHILLVGDPGCLVADERVFLGNGAIVRIGEMGSRHLQVIRTQVLTGQSGGTRDFATVFHVYQNQPVLEIITESGKSIRGTFNHPLLCVESKDGRLVRNWKRLDAFKVGDRVAVVTGVPCTITKAVPTGFSLSPRKSGPKFRGKIPRLVTAEFASLLGYVLGDGWVQKYRVGFVVAEGEKDLLEPLCEFSKDLFGIYPLLINRTLAGRTVPLTYATIGSEDVAGWLSFLKEKRVPRLILQSGNKAAAAFLRWLFEADGTVFNKGRGRRAVGLKAKNIELLRDVQVLLLRFGIHSRIVANALLIRRGESIIKFSQKIGFASEKKKTRLTDLVDAARTFKRFGQQRSEKIVEIRLLEPTIVYDVEVPNSHRFIANGVISHNTAKSAILQYVKDLAPKAIYVSGRGASGVGLTASAEKDEVADGGWVLKAGALVLASGGVVMVDEFDKMEPNDRASMHEAMEQQSYHPKTRILLADGSEREIGALVDGLIKDRRNQVIEGKDCEILSLAPGELDVFTSDFHSVCKTGVDRVSRHKAPEKFISITLRNGRNVLVTPEHPCWVIEDGRITTKPAEKVTEEDFLPVPAVIPVGGEQQRLENKVFDARKKMTVVVTRFPAHNDADFCKFVGYLITDGGYELNRGRKVGLNFTNKDDELVADFCSLSNKLFGLDPYVRRRNNGVKMARIVSKPLLNYLCQLDACFGEKSDRKRVPPALMKSPTADILPMLSAMFECDGWATRNRVGFISPNKEACEQVQTLLLRFGITSTLIEQTTSSGKKIWKVDVTGAENLRKFSGEIGFLSERKNDKLAEQIGYANFRTVIDVVPNIGRSLSRLCHMLKVDESKVLGYSLTPFKTGEQNVSKRALGKFAEAFEEKLAEFAKARDEVFTAGTPGELRQIRRRLNASLQDIEGYACSSHQNLSLAERGKGDIELLQKGLLGLADKALETGPEVVFLKRLATGDIAWSRVKKAEAISNGGVEWVYDVTVEPTRSFISECMLLHNTISIAKAGIVTTFKAKTSVLAASNPKLGRFDPNVPPAQQFDIPPTLMSRFDLIFTIKDVLDEARDRKLVDHVLTGHIMAAKKVKLEDLKGSPIVPPIYPEKLRKYIAYARRFVRPILSDEAASRIKDYYLSLRRLGAQQNTYPVTAREIEGLIRLSEASAKVRLSPTVDLQDSERAINLVHFVLSDIFMDKETGRIDSDIINTGQPKSKVDKLRAILGIISALEKKFDLVDIDAIVAEAQGVGFDEAYARRLVDELKRQGDLYEPKVGYVKSSRSKEL